MSLLAEALIEEWLNRTGYFTIRGIKTGVAEIDLLGINPKPIDNPQVHVESQVSFRPVSYTSPLTKDIAKRLGKPARSAWQRPEDILKECVKEWVEKKYKDPKKYLVRNSFYPGVNWSFLFVHGAVKHQQELQLIETEGIKVMPFFDVLKSLCSDSKPTEHTGAAGTDISEMIEYFERGSR